MRPAKRKSGQMMSVECFAWARLAHTLREQPYLRSAYKPNQSALEYGNAVLKTFCFSFWISSRRHQVASVDTMSILDRILPTREKAAGNDSNELVVCIVICLIDLIRLNGVIRGLIIAARISYRLFKFFLPHIMFGLVSGLAKVQHPDSAGEHVLELIRCALVPSPMYSLFIFLAALHPQTPLWRHGAVLSGMASAIGLLVGWAVIGYGEPEWEFTKEIPARLWSLVIFTVKTAPMAWRRRFVHKQRIEPNLVEWWLNDPLLDELAMRHHGG